MDLKLPEQDISIGCLTSIDDIFAEHTALQTQFLQFNSEREEIAKSIETCSRLHSIISVIKTHGVTPTIESMFGEDLYMIAESMMDSNRKNVPDELQVSYEEFLDTVKDKIKNFKIRFMDFLRAASKNQHSLQQHLLQSAKELEQGNYIVDVNKKLLANNFSEIIVTIESMQRVLKDPINKILVTKDAYRDNRKELIKHCEKLNISKNRNVLIKFDSVHGYWSKTAPAKRRLQTMKSAGFDHIDKLKLCVSKLAEFDIDEFLNQYYPIVDDFTDELRVFTVDQLDESERLYWMYMDYTYVMFSTFDSVLASLYLTVVSASKNIINS